MRKGNTFTYIFFFPLTIIYFLISFIYKSEISSFLHLYIGGFEFIIALINATIGVSVLTGLFRILEKYVFSLFKKIIQKRASAKAKERLLVFAKKIYFLLKFGFSVFIFLQFFHSGIIESSIRGKITLIVIVYIIIYFFSGLMRMILDWRFTTTVQLKTANASVIKFLDKLIIIGIWIIGIGFLLVQFGYNINTLLAGAGIGGLAIALAAQKSIANIFGAITIILNKPFYIGDYVNINGQEGRIKDIGLTYLTIIDRMGHRVMMPNETILTSSIANFSVRENRRTEYVIGLVYGTSKEKLQEGVSLIHNILKKYLDEGSITDDIRVNFDMFNAYSLDIKVTFFSLIEPLNDYLNQKQTINLEIKDAFENARLSMAFPTQELIVKNESVPFLNKK